MVQKFYSIKDDKMIGRAAIITTVFALVIGVAAYTTGVLGHAFFDSNTVPKLPSGGVNYDLIIPTLLTAHLPEVLLAVIMLLVLSASYNFV